MLLRYCTLVFFFKQKTAYVMRISDWSSDVCSSDLTITAGNASQLSDGASACILMSSSLAEKRNIEALGAFRGFSVAGNSPEEMGIAPVFAIPRLLSRHGLTVDDIDLWELNEAYACQVLYIVNRLGLPLERLNVNVGDISIGHPFGMTGSLQVGQVLRAGRRSKTKGARGTKWV